MNGLWLAKPSQWQRNKRNLCLASHEWPFIWIKKFTRKRLRLSSHIMDQHYFLFPFLLCAGPYMADSLTALQRFSFFFNHFSGTQTLSRPNVCPEKEKKKEEWRVTRSVHFLDARPLVLSLFSLLLWSGLIKKMTRHSLFLLSLFIGRTTHYVHKVWSKISPAIIKK